MRNQDSAGFSVGKYVNYNYNTLIIDRILPNMGIRQLSRSYARHCLIACSEVIHPIYSQSGKYHNEQIYIGSINTLYKVSWQSTIYNGI